LKTIAKNYSLTILEFFALTLDIVTIVCHFYFNQS
jgi:hypothetical protein